MSDDSNLTPNPREPRKPKSDLGVRTLSAVVMLAVAGTAIWVGGAVFVVFAALIALGVFWEWSQLVFRFARTPVSKLVWLLSGAAYIGIAVYELVVLRNGQLGMLIVATVILLVVAVDVGAYISGRTFGGPKIAPTISPSKTWAGYAGGVVAVLIVPVIGYLSSDDGDWSLASAITSALVFALIFAAVAQTGDFFESWMKRRAGVKDSSNLIPGHGGLFDRLDGLLAVLFIGALLQLLSAYFMKSEIAIITIDLPT